ncbi:hypothetical protein Ddc_20129 [Ditylenchus destructor]|nr:hypothetical protein Ddc_20129 [Ditylenchus destructor]
MKPPKVFANRGQGDIDDGGVQHDHQHAQAKHAQRQPAASLGIKVGSHGEGSFLEARKGLVSTTRQPA